MPMKRRVAFVLLSLMFMGSLWIPSGMVAHAEETSVPGYHEYITTEEEAIDHWYGISRGTYLSEGTCGIVRAGTAKVSVSGTTYAHSVCDTVRVSVHLDESSDGGVHFGQIGSWYFSESQTSSCHGSKTDISVTSGLRYMARGGHSVTEGIKTESTTTDTGSITAS